MTPITLSLSIIQTLIFAITIYSYVLIARVFISWFVPHFKETGWGSFLSNITDPFLAPFYKIKWLQLGNIHFGYVAAFITLSAVQQLLGISYTFIQNQFFSFTALLVLLLGMVVSFVQAVFFIYGIVTAVRLVTLFFSQGQSPLSLNLDALVAPLARPIAKLYRNGDYAYHFALGTIIVLCIAGYFGSSQAYIYVASFISQLGLRIQSIL
jgi:uncharacterized protein YggT (Ycf19 family)